MRPLLAGMSDTLNIMAFKWRGIRKTRNKVVLFGAGGFALLLVLGSAFSGSLLRTVMTTPTFQSSIRELQETLILWVNIFLAQNTTVAAGGVFWALLGAVIIIPLVGYSFASIVPEGDLVSIKKTDYHKIADSILLQFVSTISFVQVLVLTSLTSIFLLGSENPGFGIVMSWGLWLLSVLATVVAVWSFEYLYRKFGVKSKLFVFLGLLITVGVLWLIFPVEFPEAFGIGEAYVTYVQSLSFANLGAFFAGILVFLAVLIGLLALISFIASNTLKVTERPKKKNFNKVFVARIGLQDKNRINSLTEFLGNMVIRQNNIWKPIALSTGFIIGMATFFYNFYDVFLVVSALIPVMISLVWSINIFGIIGSGTTWLVSLPKGKSTLLSSISKIQYVIIAGITIIVAAVVFFVYHPTLASVVAFLITTAITTMVVTQFAVHKAVYNPARYRVHIRGESVLPPDKAFAYMAQLFIVAFLTNGVSYFVLNAVSSQLGNIGLGLLAQLVFGIVVGAAVYNRYLVLKRAWVADPEILQNIVKVVGQN